MARATPKSSSSTGVKKVTSSKSTSRKRKLADLDDGEYDTLIATPSKVSKDEALDDEAPAKSVKKGKKKQVEKRGRIFRKHAPLSFLEKLNRAQTQR
jgi:hypothetical protein